MAGDEVGVTDALHDALFRAYFVAGRNLASSEVLTNIAEDAGLGAAVTRAVLEDRRHQKTVDAQWDRALKVGVQGVPTFAVQGVGVVGAQPWRCSLT